MAFLSTKSLFLQEINDVFHVRILQLTSLPNSLPNTSAELRKCVINSSRNSFTLSISVLGFKKIVYSHHVWSIAGCSILKKKTVYILFIFFLNKTNSNLMYCLFLFVKSSSVVWEFSFLVLLAQDGCCTLLRTTSLFNSCSPSRIWQGSNFCMQREFSNIFLNHD